MRSTAHFPFFLLFVIVFIFEAKKQASEKQMGGQVSEALKSFGYFRVFYRG